MCGAAGVIDLIPRWLILAAVVVLIAVSAVTQVDNIKLSLEVEKGKAYAAQLETTIANANARTNARIAVSESQARKAVEAGQVRANLLMRDADSARVALDRLRDTIKSAYGLRAPSSSIGAGLDYADATADLLTVSSRYVALAEKCDGHASDVKTLTDAWPR